MSPRTGVATVIIAGLGAMGSSAAYHLARRGLRVTGLDLHEPPHVHGSSHGQSRIIREAYFEHPSYVPLVRRAYETWTQLERDAGQRLLSITGAILVGPPDGGAVEGARRSAETHGIAHRVLDAAAIRRVFPQLRPEPEEVGLHEEHAGILDPEACVSAHLRGAVAAGAELRLGEPVMSWAAAAGGGVTAVTPAGRYEADALVLAVGPWLPRVVPAIPVEIERQVTVWFRPRSAGRFGPDRFPVFLWETARGVFYGVPDLGTGVKVARHHGGRTASDLTELSDNIEPADSDPVRRFLRSRIPDAAGEIISASVCRYTNTRDGHFLLDRHPEHPGVWLASACSGHGFKFSSVLGAALAAQITTGENDPDLRMFRWRTAVQSVL